MDSLKPENWKRLHDVEKACQSIRSLGVGIESWIIPNDVFDKLEPREEWGLSSTITPTSEIWKRGVFVYFNGIKFLRMDPKFMECPSCGHAIRSEHIAKDRK